MPILTRAADGVESFPKPIEHVVACVACPAEGPPVVQSPFENGSQGVAAAIAEAKMAGFKETRNAGGGHFRDYLCPTCAGGLL